MLFPKSIGLSMHGKDLIISKASQRFMKCNFESTVVRDFLLKESLDLRLIIDARGFHAGDIILSWPREKTIVREIELPGSSINELKESISYQLDSFIPFSEDDVYYDIYPSNSPEYGERALIFAVKKEEIDELMSKLESSNLLPDRIIISPLSYIPLVNDNKVVVIEKCNVIYTFNVYEDSNLVSSSLIKNTDALKERISENNPDDVILPGQIHDVVKDGNEDINVEYWEKEMQSLGAALNGMSERLNRFNILKSKRKRCIPEFALTVILALFILAFIFIIPGVLNHKKEQSIRMIDERLERLRPEAMISGRLSDQINSILVTKNKIDEIINSKSQRRIDLLAELTREVPEDTWVKQLSFKEDIFEIEGIGLSGAKILTLLEYSPRFDHVSFTSSVTKDKFDREKFKIRGRIK